MARVRGLDATLSVTVDGTTKILTGGVDGVQSITPSFDEEQTRPIPSAGIIAFEPTGHTTGRFSCSVDANETSSPVLFLTSGRRAAIVFRERGDGRGKPEVQFSGILLTSLSGLRGTVLRFEMTVNIDGAIVRTTQ